MRVPRGGGSEKGSKGGPGSGVEWSGVEVRCDHGGCRPEDPGEVRWGGEADRECTREASESDWGDAEQSRGIASGKSLQSSELW